MPQTVVSDANSLLKVFECLFIDIGTLNKNVIKAWFDTFDEDTIHLLNFMSQSLSGLNVLEPKELEEYTALSHIHEDGKLNSAIQKVENEYPGIFENYLNSEELKVVLDELHLLNTEEEKLNDLLNTEKQIQGILLQENSNLEKIAVTLDFKCDGMRKTCENLCETLDSMNENMTYKELNSVLFELSNLLFGKSYVSLNHMPIAEFQDPAEFDCSIQGILKKKHNSSGNFSPSMINLNSTPNDKKSEENLETYKQKIYSSHLSYLDIKFEEASLLEGLHFLENLVKEDYFSEKKIFSINSSSFITGQTEVLHKLLENNVDFLSGESINDLKVERTQYKLKILDEQICCLNQIWKYYSKDLCLLLCVYFLLLQELYHIENSVTFLKQVYQYIFHILEASRCRSEDMHTIICSFSDYLKTPILYRLEPIPSLVDIFLGSTINEVFLASDLLYKGLRKLENVYFMEITSELIDNMRKHLNIDEVQIFLYSGPTKRSLAIPQRIQKTLKSVLCDFDKQLSTIKILIQTNNYYSKKFISDEWSRNIRLLWIYFLTSPKKMLSELNQLNEHIKIKESKTVRFKV